MSLFERLRPRVLPRWFSPRVSYWRALGLTQYLYSPDTRSRFGYVTTKLHTKVIDLEQDEAAILAGFSTRTRNYVRRAAREGLHFRESDDVDGFVAFFNRFAQRKGLDYRVSGNELRNLGVGYRIVHALREDQVLAMHLIVCDPGKQRARCMYLASILRDERKPVNDVLIGIANKAAHFHEMCMFKRLGYKQFDLGGYAVDTDDPELQQINRFKDSLGGRVMSEANHRSLPLHLASALLARLRRSTRDRTLARPLGQRLQAGAKR